MKQLQFFLVNVTAWMVMFTIQLAALGIIIALMPKH